MALRSRLAGLLASISLVAPPADAARASGPSIPDDASAEASTSESTIRLLTLNTWGLPVARRRARFEGIRSYLERASVDLAALQEVWRGAARLLPVDGLLRAPLDDGDSGLALVTRWPISEVVFTPYSTARGWDAFKRKGVLQARVQAPGLGALRILATHMQAGGSRRAAEIRAIQAEELLAQVETAEEPAVVLGDFNLAAHRPLDRATARQLAEAGLVDAAAHVGDPVPTHARDGCRYDRVYLRSNAATRLEADQVVVPPYGGELPALSDHRPVEVRVRVQR